MKTILIPTDFSDPARHALQYAVRVFGTGSKYMLLHAFEDRGSTAEAIVPLRDILGEASVDSLGEEKEFVCQAMALPDISITTISIHSDPVSAVRRCVSEHAVDVIVMGATGASGLKESGAGSVATSLMQDAPCPVLAVPVAPGGRPEHVYFVPGPAEDTWLQTIIAGEGVSIARSANIHLVA